MGVSPKIGRLTIYGGELTGMDFVDFTTGCFVPSCLALCFHVFSVLFSVMITLLGEERAGLCASHAFVCLFCTHQFMSFSSSS